MRDRLLRGGDLPRQHGQACVPRRGRCGVPDRQLHPADAEGGLQTQYVIPRRVHIRFRAVQIAGRSAPAQKCRRIRQRRAEFGGEMEIYVGKAPYRRGHRQ